MVPDSLHEAGLPEVLEPSEGDMKKRRVESFGESVEWFLTERSSFTWMTSDEREICENDVGDLLESERSFCRDSSMWLSKTLSASEVTFHRLLPGQQLQFDEAVTKELSQVLAANAVRRLSQEEELNLKPKTFVAHAVGSHVEVHSRWKQENKGDAGYFGLSASRAYKCTNCCNDTWKDVSSFVTSSIASYTNFVSILVMSPRLSCKHQPLKSIES